MKEILETLNVLYNRIESDVIHWDDMEGQEEWAKEGRDNLARIDKVRKSLPDLLKGTYNNAIDIAAKNFEGNLEPMGWLAEKHLDEPLQAGVDYEVGFSRSSILELKIK